MALQTISGNTSNIGANVSTGTIKVIPAEYPQAINNVVITTPAITANITGGAFSFQLIKGAKVKLRGIDNTGRTFLSLVFTVSSKDTENLANYI